MWNEYTKCAPVEAGRYLVVWHGHIVIRNYALNLEEVDKYDFAGIRHPGWYNYDMESGYYQSHGITHWMPLPKKPEEVK